MYLKRLPTHMRMFWAAYALTCFTLHHLLTTHHQDVCRPAFWSFGQDPSLYCAFVHKALYALRAGPVLAIANLPLLHQ